MKVVRLGSLLLGLFSVSSVLTACSKAENNGTVDLGGGGDFAAKPDLTVQEDMTQPDEDAATTDDMTQPAGCTQITTWPALMPFAFFDPNLGYNGLWSSDGTSAPFNA